MKILVQFLFVVVGFCFAPALAQSDKSEGEGLRGRYYMVVWAYQGADNAPRDSHTFAAFYNGAQANKSHRGVLMKSHWDSIDGRWLASVC